MHINIRKLIYLMSYLSDYLSEISRQSDILFYPKNLP